MCQIKEHSICTSGETDVRTSLTVRHEHTSDVRWRESGVIMWTLGTVLRNVGLGFAGAFVHCLDA